MPNISLGSKKIECFSTVFKILEDLIKFVMKKRNSFSVHEIFDEVHLKALGKFDFYRKML